MWLIDMTINITTHHISTEVVEDSRLSNIYWNAIISMDEVRISQPHPWGGLASFEFGTMRLRPDLFTTAAGDWPPPASCPIAIQFLGDDGTVSPTLFAAGTANLQTISRTGIVYKITQADLLGATVDDALYQGTLVDVVTAAVAAAWPGSLLVTAGARSPSPPVDYLAKGTRTIADNLSDMAAFHAHRLVYDAVVNTFYLFDVAANFTTSSRSESDYVEMRIEEDRRWSRYVAEYTLKNANVYKFRPLAVHVPGNWSVALAEITVQHDEEGGMYAPVAADAFPDGRSGYEATKAIDSNATTYWESEFDSVGLTGFIQVGSGNVSITNYSFQMSGSWQGAPTKWELSVLDPNTSAYRVLGIDEVRSPWTGIGEIKSFRVPEHRFDVVVSSALVETGEEVRISPVCAAEYADIEGALYTILVAVERPRVSMVIPLIDTLPRIGKYYAVGPDSGLPVETLSWMRVDEILYNMDESTCQVSGFGGYL